MRNKIGIILILLSIIPIAFAQSSIINGTSYTSAYANQTINQTISYITAVNQSAYLIFYPNLTAAYSYINKAQKLSVSSPDGAVSYANLAYSSAQSQYEQLGAYRTESLIAMLFVAAVFLIWTYSIMKRVRQGKVK